MVSRGNTVKENKMDTSRIDGRAFAASAQQRGLMSGGLNVPVQPREKTPIEVNWNILEVEAKRLSAIVIQLYTKLHPVLTPNAPPENASGKGQIPAVSPMVEIIPLPSVLWWKSFIVVAENLASSNSALERLLERVEL
jgi:hypothetical protein